MKKEYKAPFIRMVEAETEELMQLSLVKDQEADPNSTVLSRDNNDSWGRGRSVWDDEE